jgi:cytochrome o ubiquinol oxidase subunit 2
MAGTISRSVHHDQGRPTHANPSARKRAQVARVSRSCLPVLLIGFPLLSGCAALQLGVVNHAGPIAESQWRLYLVVGFVLIFVALPVLLLTPLMAWHYRLSNRHGAFRPRWNFSWVLEAFIWIPPTAIVIGLAFILWTSTHELDPYRAISSEQPTLEVEAAALDWKWLFIYPREKIAVLNQLAIPVGRPVHISLTSGTVMQSLLIPQLAGQIYAMAGMTQSSISPPIALAYSVARTRNSTARAFKTRSSTCWL